MADGELDLPARTPLPAAADSRFDHMAALTCRILGVRTALVSLVDRDGQVFPGAVGLPARYQQERGTPLSHSFCQHVVRSARPLIVSDAREDDRLRDNAAIPDLGVVAYAGIPLRDSNNRVIGSLCAIDSTVRTWTDLEIANLVDLAEACESELQLREVTDRAAVAVDRERIAHELHNEVFGNLMSLSMLLGNARDAAPGDSPGMIDDAIDQVDTVMRNIGSTIFARDEVADDVDAG